MKASRQGIMPCLHCIDHWFRIRQRTSFPCAKNTLGPRWPVHMFLTPPLGHPHTHTGTIPISGAPSQSLGGASFRAFEPKRGWKLGSARAAEDDFFSREAPSHDNRDGRLAQVTRQNLMRVSNRVNIHPIFCTLLTPFAALRAAVCSFCLTVEKGSRAASTR